MTSKVIHVPARHLSVGDLFANGSRIVNKDSTNEPGFIWVRFDTGMEMRLCRSENVSVVID